jgi:hypothetical protein
VSLFLLYLLEELLNLACSLLVLHFHLSQLIHLLYIPGQLRKHVPSQREVPELICMFLLFELKGLLLFIVQLLAL